MRPADNANVDWQYVSNVSPTMFVPSTDPIRPNIIVMLIAMPLKCQTENLREKSLTIELAYRKFVGNKSTVVALTTFTARNVSMNNT